MIHYATGDLLASNAQALVNTVNTVGVMGKGIALQFKNLFPNNYKAYAKLCKEKQIEVGKLFVFEEETTYTGKKLIINFPTKTDWRKPSEYSYIEAGLQELVRIIEERGIHSIALPPLGAGNGGLDWNRVKAMMETYLSTVDAEVYIYEPNAAIQEAMKSERVKLTPARAMLLSVLFDLVKNGEFVSEFAAEKIAYFLQRFGAREQFKLDFQPNFYGPYSGKVKHVLYYLNGSYITGYSAKDKKPFEELGIMMDAEDDVLQFLKAPGNEENLRVVEKTKEFLSGFYSSFGLELLSTVDYIAQTRDARTPEAIESAMHDWSERKSTMFGGTRFTEVALRNLEAHHLVA